MARKRQGFALKSMNFGRFGNDRHTRSGHDGSVWETKRWRKVEGDVVPCLNGFHMTTPRGFANWYDWSNYLYVVEYRGDTVVADPRTKSEKRVSREMRVIKRCGPVFDVVKAAIERLGLDVTPYGSYGGWTQAQGMAIHDEVLRHYYPQALEN